MKRIAVLALGLCAFFGAKAQVSPDYPLYFSQHGINGTANYISRGGAIGAVGGDIMASHYNPAGLGLYKKSEITFSSGLNFNYTSSKLEGLSFDNNRTSYNFGNFGMVLSLRNSDHGLKYVQIGVGLNRLKNFSNQYTTVREGLGSSYINDVVMNAIVDNRDADNMFIKAGVVDLDSNGTISSLYESGTFNQIRSSKTTGYINEFSFSLSGNVNDRLYFGATLGVPYGYYKNTSQFAETRFSEEGDDNGYYNYTQTSELSATGVNFKAGVILRPINMLRIGAAIHTPTYYYVQDDYYADVEYNRTSGGVAPTLEYDIQSPFRFLGSIALVFGNNRSPVGGTISADYEFADYSSMRYRFDSDVLYETQINRQIEDLFRAAHTFRLGGELKLGTFAIRAGYAYMGNPYNEPGDAALNSVSAGFGFKGKYYSFDIAYANIFGNQDYQFYDNSIASISKTNHLIQATFGVRF